MEMYDMDRQELEARGGTRAQQKLQRLKKFEDAFKASHSNLWHYLVDEVRPASSLRVSEREGGFLAICQRWDEDRFWVCFAQGETLYEALFELNRSIAANRWKLDQWANDRIRDRGM
jgi:hypothetical protein